MAKAKKPDDRKHDVDEKVTITMKSGHKVKGKIYAVRYKYPEDLPLPRIIGEGENQRVKPPAQEAILKHRVEQDPSQRCDFEYIMELDQKDRDGNTVYQTVHENDIV